MRRSVLVVVLVAVAADVGAARLVSDRRASCGTTRLGAQDSVWSYREQHDRRGPVALSARDDSFDVGQIAVLRDQGDLALLKSSMDLQGTALRFTPTSAGYSVSRLALPLEPDTASPLSLTDDSSTRLSLGLSFPFYGRRYSEAFVNSDGNLTFGEKDDASTERNVGRLLNGPPRVAPLLADLDPGTGGTVSARTTADHVTVTWKSVPQFEKSDRNTFQVTLWADGRIDFVYDPEVSRIERGVVGIAPGAAQGGLTAVDFSAATAVAGGAGALAESFREENEIDPVAVARRFYAGHPDDYQQLVVYSSRTLVSSDVVAYQLNVQQPESGIGNEPLNLSSAFGSRGTLESFVMMDLLAGYPDDPSFRFLGEDSALSVLAHETGHRWLAQALFRDGSVNSTELLGRDEVHWSFFMDSDGSFLEGNDIEPQANGSFLTVGSALRYSALDQYLMGLRPASEVPPFFFVRTPENYLPLRSNNPVTGIPFAGVRKDVTIDDVVTALGPRQPAGAPWTRPFRQAYVYVAIGTDPADAATLGKMERIRVAFPAFFFAATEGRGTVETRLD